MGDFGDCMYWNLTGFIGAILISIGLWLGWREHKFLAAAEMTEGKVIRIERDRKIGSRTDYWIHPTIRFKGAEGSLHEFTTGHRRGFGVGDTVPVAYHRGKEHKAKIAMFDDRFRAESIAFWLGLGFLGFISASLSGKN
jgi:hypothetical protein